MANHEGNGECGKEEGMVRTILHLCLVILSAAKELFQLSEITHKTVIHPERSIILNALSSGTYCHPVRLRRIGIFQRRVHGL